MSRPAAQILQAQAVGVTDPGNLRPNNEDHYSICDLKQRTPHPEHPSPNLTTTTATPGLLVIVSDGMGGANAGEAASRLACEYITAKMRDYTAFHLPASAGERSSMLIKALQTAHDAILEVSIKTPGMSGMGATATALWLTGHAACLAHVGDSRLYLLRHHRLQQLSHDQTMVGELVRAGHLSSEQARKHPRRNLLDQALGAGMRSVQPQSLLLNTQPDDLLLLCSDGLNDSLDDATIAHLLDRDADRPLPELCAHLVATAKQAGGADNITAALIRLQQPPTS